MRQQVFSKAKKALLFCGILLCAQNLLAGKSRSHTRRKPIEVLRHFNATGDTTGLERCIVYLNDNMDIQGTHELVSALRKSVREGEARNISQLAGLYGVLKKHYDNTGNKPKSFEYAMKIYKLLSKSRREEDLLWILIDIGNIFYNEKDYGQARIFYQRAENIAARGKDMYPFSVIYLNYGLIEADQGNHEKALRHYKTSCEYRAKSDNIKMISNTYIKIANTYLTLQKPDSSLYYIRLAEDYYYHKGEETAALIDMPDYIFFSYAEYHAYFRDFEKAHYYIRKAQDYCRRNGITEELIVDIDSEANYFFMQGKFAEAVKCISQVLPYLEANNMLEAQKKVYKKLGRYFSAQQDYAKADEAMENYMEIDDHLDDSNLRSQLNMIRSIAAVYESDAKLQEIRKNLHIEKINDRLRIKERNASILITVIALAIILVLLFLFFKLRASRRKLMMLHGRLVSQNQEISINSVELERTNQLKDKLFSIIAHDLRNPLNRLMVELAIVKKSISSKNITTQMENTLRETIDLFEGLLQWSKLDNKQNIYSPTKISLADNISKALVFYSPEIRERGIEVVNQASTMSAFADQNIFQTLLRNLISNAVSSVSQAEVRRIGITSRQTAGDKIEIVFSDSGPGFPEEVIAEFYSKTKDINSGNNGLGLSICKLLAKMSGWKMDISNGGTSGAEVRISIPLFVDPKLLTYEFAAPGRISADWKARLGGISTYKFYQTSQIRSFIRSLGEIPDSAVRAWIRNVEKAVHDGDENAYRKLLAILEQ